jgi:uncharacterized membrane protein YjfL (UPF0719 family)
VPLLHIFASVLEFAITVIMAVLVVYATLRALIRTNTDFDEDKALHQGNAAVGVLIAALLLGSAHVMYRALEPVTDLLREVMASSVASELSLWKLLLAAAGNLVIGFVIVVATMSFSLRLFGKLMRREGIRAGQELEKGNLAVGILLAAVVTIVSFFVGDGVKAVSKVILPAPAAGVMRILR